MLNNNNICALFRQSWYEATKPLKAPTRLAFFDICMSYEFYGIEPNQDTTPTELMVLFAMVKGDIDRDKERATQRAAISKANGAKGGRPPKEQKITNEENPAGFLGFSEKPNETQKNPLYTSTYTYNNNSTIHTEEVEEIFYEMGFKEVRKEAARFIDYYSSKDWKDSRGQAIKHPEKLATIWKSEAGYIEHGIKQRQLWAHICKQAHLQHNDLFKFVYYAKDRENIKLYLTDKLTFNETQYNVISSILQTECNDTLPVKITIDKKLL